MSPKTFLDHFAAFAEAPNAVPRLRAFVLQLAVQGKLVYQCDHEESAFQLIEKIEAEKARLVSKTGLKIAATTRVNDEEVPYLLPNGWVWTRLANIGLVNPRNDFDDQNTASFVPMNLVPQKYGESIRTETRYWGEIKKGFTHFAEGDVVLAKITPCFQNGKACVMRGLENNLGAGTTELHVFRPIDGLIHPEYVLGYLKSPGFLLDGIPRMTGTAGQKRVPTEYFAQNPFPLPPFEEQKRIVAKVNDLMQLCDKLEAQQQAKRESRVRVNNAALRPLNKAASLTRKEFEQASARLAEHFDTLYDSVDTVGKLRSTVLQLAVQGKLVSQDLREEPTIRNLKQPEFPTPDCPHFRIPRGWQCVRLGELCDLLNGFAFKSETYVPKSSHQIIRLGNVKNNAILLDQKPAFISDKIAEQSSEYLIRENDLLITMTGTKAKRDYLFTSIVRPSHLLQRRLFLNQRVGALRFSSADLTELANMFLKADLLLDQLFAQSTGTANQGNIGVTSIRNLHFPLPPIPEQKRIVAKVNLLMALCDDLEAKLLQAEADSEKLMNAAVQHVLDVVTGKKESQRKSALAFSSTEI